jgi:hypothetical protein
MLIGEGMFNVKSAAKAPGVWYLPPGYRALLLLILPVPVPSSAIQYILWYVLISDITFKIQVGSWAHGVLILYPHFLHNISTGISIPIQAL